MLQRVNAMCLCLQVAGETAYDAYSGTDGRGPHGLFTYYLLDGLAGAADSDADGWITDVELYAHVSNQVPQQANALQNHKQNPQVGFRGEGRILFANPQIAEIRASMNRSNRITELTSENEALKKQIEALRAQSKAKDGKIKGLTQSYLNVSDLIRLWRNTPEQSFETLSPTPREYEYRKRFVIDGGARGIDENRWHIRSNHV